MKAPDRQDTNLVKIQRGLRGILARTPIQRIELRHLNAAGGEAVAMSMDGESLQNEIKTSGGLEQAASLLAEQILAHAEEEAKTLRGVNRFGVAVYNEGDREYKNRILFTLRGSAIEDSDSIEETEPANSNGMVSQMMRHNEILLKSTVQGHEKQVRYYEGMLHMLTNLLTNATEKQIRVLEVTEQLIDRKAERDLEVEHKRKSEQFKTRALEQFMMLSGPLLKKLLPADGAVQATADDHLLITLVASLTEQQVGGIMETLQPEQRAAFFELYSSLKQRHQAVQLGTGENGAAKKENPS